jgi:hypothetical protein
LFSGTNCYLDKGEDEPINWECGTWVPEEDFEDNNLLCEVWEVGDIDYNKLTWTCYWSSDWTNASCKTTTPTDWVCWDSNNWSFASEPSNLCEDWSMPEVTWTWSWNWTCRWSNGWINADCSASKTFTCWWIEPTWNGVESWSSTATTSGQFWNYTESDNLSACQWTCSSWHVRNWNTCREICNTDNNYTWNWYSCVLAIKLNSNNCVYNPDAEKYYYNRSVIVPNCFWYMILNFYISELVP